VIKLKNKNMMGDEVAALVVDNGSGKIQGSFSNSIAFQSLLSEFII